MTNKYTHELFVFVRFKENSTHGSDAHVPPSSLLSVYYKVLLMSPSAEYEWSVDVAHHIDA